MSLHLQSPVSAMRGVGEARAAALGALGILHVEDLLRHFPRGYQCRGDVRTLAEAAQSVREGNTLPVSVVLTVSAEPNFRVIRRGMSILRFRAFDESGVCEITYFNQNFLKNTFHTGGEFRFFGKMTVEGKVAKMASPVWEPCVPGQDLPYIIPVYPLAAGLTQKILSQLVRDALSAVGQFPETLPADVLRRQSLCTLSSAMRNIHFPEDMESLARARRRLVFEQFFAVGLAMAALRAGTSVPGPVLTDRDIGALLARLPYRLTGAQNRAILAIADDMASGIRMNRILMGDVGSGKTVVAAAAAYIAVRNGYQTALMAPTEILAAQHFRELDGLLSPLGIRCVLLTGSVTAAQKRKIYESLAASDGFAQVAVGTHALLSEGVRFTRLGLVIEDEQHRFGVMQRAALADKNGTAHMLVMSATPIPRTLSLIAYGGIAVSRLDEMPPGRQTVDTFVVDESYRTRLNAFIRRQVQAGHQVYVVCPAVEEASEKINASDDPEEVTDILLREERHEERPPLKAAVEYSKTLAEALPDLRIGFVHGKLKSAEKDRVMNAFCAGELDVLVSTTVIEVGVNVPSATLMIVENAERFGLSQLHQLRGRVGRGKDKSYCILVSDAKGENARRRLEILKKNHDGCAIAEEDLKLRGPGDYLASGGIVRQHGAAEFPIAVGANDMEILEKAMEEARALLETDPALSHPDHALLKETAERIRRAASNTMN